MTGSSFLPE